MNYELAKQLKDAGFPQRIQRGDDFFHTETRSTWWETEDLQFHFTDPAFPVIKIPTLEELIEACGDDFKGLIPNMFSHAYIGDLRGKRNWIGIGKDQNAHGATIIEAVANLWLALRSK